IQFGQQAVAKAIAQPRDAAAFFRQPALRNLTGLAEAHDSRNVECAGAHAMFVAAAVDDRGELYAGADVQGAATFGAVAFVRGNGGEIKLKFVHVEWHAAEGLHRVRVEEHAAFTAK